MECHNDQPRRSVMVRTTSCHDVREGSIPFGGTCGNHNDQ